MCSASICIGHVLLALVEVFWSGEHCSAGDISRKSEQEVAGYLVTATADSK